MSGWIKLHRSIQDHFIYDFSEPDKALAWVDILLSACFQDSKVKIKSTLFTVKKGQWLVSQVTLQKRWRMSQNKVKRLLLMLKKEGMIDFEANELATIITICNYDDFQDGERANERANERAGERATDEQANDILRSKEDKEVKNIKDLVDSGESQVTKNKAAKLDFSAWPQQPDPEILKAWLAMRKRVKASCSQLAINTIGDELHKAVANGFSVDYCLMQAEASGWKGFKSAWVKHEEQHHGYQNGSTSSRAAKLEQWRQDTSRKLADEVARLEAEISQAGANGD